MCCGQLMLGIRSTELSVVAATKLSSRPERTELEGPAVSFPVSGRRPFPLHDRPNTLRHPRLSLCPLTYQHQLMQHPTADTTRVLTWIVLVASSLICLSIDYRLRILAADDSYIHLRIATHLMTTGHGYFNLGEKVMVTSSPVWTLLLGVSAWLCHDFPAALALEAASMGLACTMSFLLISRNLPLGTLRAILLSLIAPAAVFLILLQSTIQQMESTLAVGLVLTSIYLFDIGNIWWPSLLVLAAFTRYEYFAVLVIMAGVALAAKRLKLTPAVIAATSFFRDSFVSPLSIRDVNSEYTKGKGSRVCRLLHPNSRILRTRIRQTSCRSAHLSAVGRADSACHKQTPAKTHCPWRYGLRRRAFGAMLHLEKNLDIPVVPPSRLHAHRARAYLERTWLRRQSVEKIRCYRGPFGIYKPYDLRERTRSLRSQ